MGFLVGTDEAGYGPNLGPLIVSATVWEGPDGGGASDLARLAAGPIVASPGLVAADHPSVVLGDSKVLYQSGKGLQHLERGLWAAMAALGHRPGTWRQVWQVLAPDSDADLAGVPWHADYDRPAPLDADGRAIESAVAAFAEGLAAADARLVRLQSRAVFPAEFNRLVRECGSKGTALSRVTLGLAAELIARLEDRPICVFCDKHGGRNRYRDLLSERFPEALIEIHGEGRQRSVYRFGPARRRVEFRFEAQGEAHLPAALASMASKYLRELAMRAWNDYWCGRVPGLTPTAGYPQDARRFKDAIAPVQRELGIDDAVIWREK